ncbi:MAG: DUF4189 domain-containing protein [Stellaceae bacterium]
MKRWAIGALCAGCILIGSSQPVLAYTFYYESAIAYDPTTGALGWSTGSLYTRDAVQAALRACQGHGGTHCKLAIPTFDSCGAVSVGSNGHYWGIGLTKDLAVSRSMNACGQDGSRQCKVVVSLCSEMGSAPDVNPLPGLGGGGANTCNNPHLPNYKPYMGPLCE